ncbi:MAG: cation:proton antiporter [Bacteroidales bacterium]|jgi:CPA2 family monovalent cation:H+ antiporter-2|nr:cation:proton antiporter [Bacteroidales bacterium]
MEAPILQDIVVIFAIASVVNILFSRIKIPTIIGYLFTGIIAGPHVFGIITAQHDIEILAEIGVIFLLFTIGLEFSLKHLLKIRKVVFWGGLIQMTLTTIIFFFISFFYDLTWKSGLFIGFLATLSSSALVLKILQERSELTSNSGRTILGILIFQDIMLVPLLLYTNILSSSNVNILNEIVLLLIKASFIIGLVYFGNRWLLPKIMNLITHTKSQEMFMMAILLTCFGIALLTNYLGMSLAFGAFLAGLMISESEYSHNVFGNLLPIKDIFTSFFFVSIGMLLNLEFVAENSQVVLFSILLVLGIKTIIAGGTGFVLGHTFKGTVMIGLALSQVGEFSFILAKIGLKNDIISDYVYQLFLAVAVITMALTPFLLNISPLLTKTLMRLPLPNVLLKGLFPLPEIEIPQLLNHLVIIGKDRSALHVSNMAKKYSVEHSSIVFDPEITREKLADGDNVVYGDAINEPILLKAHVETADVVFISVGDIIPTMVIIEKIRMLNKKSHIIVRAKNLESVEQLYKLGADEVYPEKFEIGIGIWNRILLKKQFSQKKINTIINQIRLNCLGEFLKKDTINKPSPIQDISHITITALEIEEGSCMNNTAIINSNLRKETGATILAVKRASEMIEHPTPDFVLQKDDIAYLMGNQEQITLATNYFLSKENQDLDTDTKASLT